jgi:DNA-binding MarR family transcriptional regulator
MMERWTAQTAAETLLDLFPGLGRLMAMRMREVGEDDDAGTMMQMRVLAYLQQEPMTTSELAKRRKVSLQSASVLIQGMVEKGWIIRSPDPKDRRQWLLEVTPSGQARAKAAHELVSGLLTEVLSELTEEELEAAAVFLPGLRRIVNGRMTSNSLPEKEDAISE